MKLLVFLGSFLLIMSMQAQKQATVAEVQEFMDKAEAQLADQSVRTNRAQWVQSNFITDDTEALASDAVERTTSLTTDMIEQAKKF